MPPYPSSQNGSLRSPSLTTLSPSSSYSVFTSSASIDWMSSLLNWLPSPSPLSSRVLEKLPPAKRKGKLLPEIDKGSGEGKELCSLVVDIVVSLLRCAATGLAKEDAHLRKVLQLVEEVNPWLRRLDSNSYEKLHKMLVTHLGKCTLNLLGSTPFPDRDLVTLFCCTTLTEYVKSPIKDQVYKIALRVCSLLFALRDNNSLYIMDILESIVRECKVEEENTGTDFVELVYYYANKCQTANASFCNTFAAYLNKIEEHFKQVMTPINSILRLYVVGLLLKTRKYYSVPDLETVDFKVLTRMDQYEIREVEMEDQENWKMSFVMPSKYGANLPLPKDSSVRIKKEFRTDNGLCWHRSKLAYSCISHA
ncbi:Separase [Glycine max]|nr:Separase [Glycine max]